MTVLQCAYSGIFIFAGAPTNNPAIPQNLPSSQRPPRLSPERGGSHLFRRDHGTGPRGGRGKEEKEEQRQRKQRGAGLTHWALATSPHPPVQSNSGATFLQLFKSDCTTVLCCAQWCYGNLFPHLTLPSPLSFFTPSASLIVENSVPYF